MVRVTHGEVLRLIRSGSQADEEAVNAYLDEMAEAFSLGEAFAIMALVDTPDVFG